MTSPALSEATIRAHVASESFSRGLAYYQQGAVGDLSLRGDALLAEVEGSEPAPYRVRVTIDQGGVVAASCTCPYDWGGWCKHIVAVLLKYVYEPEAIVRRPPLDQQLAGLERDQLQTLLLDLAAHEPDIADAIDRRVALLRLASVTLPAGDAALQERQAAAFTRRSPIDQETIREQVRLAMRPPVRGRYDYDYHDEDDPGDEVVAAVRPLLEQASRFVEGGDAHSGLEVLEALTDAYLNGARQLYDRYEEMYGAFEGSAVEFFDELAAAWAEALLSADLDDEERDELGEMIAGWQDDLDELGVGRAFELALTAADQGWDYPPLRGVLQGQITDLGAWEGESPDYADKLALIRLRVLERQGRRQEYLFLAQAEGQIDRYVAMLAKMGRTAEALDEGLKYLTTPQEVGEVARLLREQGDLSGALRLAEHGLAQQAPDTGGYSYYGDSRKAELASWAADLAQGMGERGRALHAAEAAFRLSPSLRAYQRAQDLAGDRWDEVRPALLQHLRESHAAEAKVDVFLHERLFDDAIAAVRNGYGALLERVMDAVVALRPDWVVDAATRQAEAIMNSGKAQHYDAAASWLRRAREGYRAASREGDWLSYMSDLRARHGRKYKLMGLLQGL
ncbi:MAG: SWIM zinc finger domain-containing protein [Kouleothrix sp.]|nr:SWIM zinc finger domain-containing protein [Kouleothrix sp.]